MDGYAKFFRLQEGEKIVEAIKPLPSLKWFFFVKAIIGWVFFVLLFGAWFFLGSFKSLGALVFSLVGFSIIILLILVVPYILAVLKYNKRFYWITNKRVVGKSGLVGYKVNSIPLERISDLIISRSFLESLFGFGSVHIQTLAGQVSVRGRFGAEGNFQAVPDPEGLQQKVFELIKKKRKAEGITM